MGKMGLAFRQKWEEAMRRTTHTLPSISDVILWFIYHNPGRTEAEIAQAMFGKRQQPRVHQYCDGLESLGLIERRKDTYPMRLYPGNR
jgi:hypothetical protein